MLHGQIYETQKRPVHDGEKDEEKQKPRDGKLNGGGSFFIIEAETPFSIFHFIARLFWVKNEKIKQSVLNFTPYFLST
jgi:hypothetical protein